MMGSHITSEKMERILLRFPYMETIKKDCRGGTSMSLKEYMELPYSMSIIPDTVEGGFTVIFPELPGCMTCGDTIEEAVEMAMDAKKCWLEDAIEMGKKIPLP